MKNIRIIALILTILTVVTTAAVFPSCSAAKNDNTAKQPAGTSDTSALSDLFFQSRMYEPFYVPGEEISDNLQNAVKNAAYILAHSSTPDKDIQNAVNELNAASENFKTQYLDSTVKLKNAGLIVKLYINGVKCAYDSQSQTFYYTMGKTPDKEFTFDFNAENAQNESENIFAEIYDPDNNLCAYRFVPQLNKEYSLKAQSQTEMCDYTIIFTMLPIVQINDIPLSRLDKDTGTNYQNCTISVTDPDFSYGYGSTTTQSNFFVESTAGIHIRGGIARSFPKKSYALKFVDDTGANKNFQLFGLRKSSDWILDAMYIDKARSRNRVSTDIWNDIESPLYYSDYMTNPQTNGTRGVFVEVFANDEYRGLYCFTEKIDKQQLQLQSNDDGLKSVTYKGKAWGDALLFRNYSPYDNNSMTWDAFQQKYPRPQKGGQIDWAPLADFVNFGVNSIDEDFAANVSKYIDIDNFVDYTLFLSISYAYDNTGKNAYWSIYDITDDNLSKIFLTPWDLDATWGGSWDGSRIPPDFEWMDSASYEHDSHLFRRLILTNADGFADKLKAKWESLKDNKLSAETIYARFANYLDLFDVSGAWQRESAKWQECNLNLDDERSYLQQWITARWNYIDDFITNKLNTVGDYAAVPPQPKRRGR